MTALNRTQREYLTGSVLGDDYLRGKTLQIMHSIKQAGYVSWKFNLFSNLTKSVGPSVVKSKNFVELRFYISRPSFQKIHDEHYQNGRKVILRNTLEKLTPFGLAVWYMDDGYMWLNLQVGRRHTKLITNNYSYEEHLLMRNYFKSVWRLNCKIEKCRKYFQLDFDAGSSRKFVSIIDKFIIPSMRYKVNFQYKSIEKVKQMEAHYLSKSTCIENDVDTPAPEPDSG
jgi:hypothetical protein